MTFFESAVDKARQEAQALVSIVRLVKKKVF